MKKRLFQVLIICIVILLAVGCTIDLANRDKVKEKKTLKKTSEEFEDINITCENPQIFIDGECCLDENNNSECDKYELESFCGDDVCSKSEDSCTCPEDCGECSAKKAGICHSYQCINNSCVQVKDNVCCGDGVCNEMYEACGTCFQDCCELTNVLHQEKTNLKNYPSFFDGISTVVGDKAPPEDVIIAGDILTHMVSENFTVGNGLLSSEIFLGNKDYLVIGNPCDNPSAFDLFRNQIFNNNDDCQIFDPGEGVIKIFPVSTYNVIIYIGGYSPIETEKASKYLINHKTKNPSGSEIWI